MNCLPGRWRPMLVVAIIGFAQMLSATDAIAQNAASDEEEIRDVVTALFDAMRAGDGDRVRSLFHSSATMGTAISSPDSAFVRLGDVNRFADAVGDEREEAWDERIRDLTVSIDGPLASAWMEYAFFVGDRFSHCGSNAMTFLRTGDGWRILTVFDTRRTDDCEPSEWN